MLYHAYELTHAALAPWKAACQIGQQINSSPLNPLSYTPAGRSSAAVCEVFNRLTQRYGKPDWQITETEVEGQAVDVQPEIKLVTTFCDIVHFRKTWPEGEALALPKVLIVAPLSGHYATLLRGTVCAMLPGHDVYITDWRDARMIPTSYGGFDLDDHIDLMIDFMRYLGPDLHIIAVCQPSVPVLAAVSLMAAEDDPAQPVTMTLMGGPIDIRVNPTASIHLAATRDINWFEHAVVSRVPFPHPGFMRQVYPGFLQLTGFMTMNLDRHMQAQVDLYTHLVEGDGDSAEQHKAFYEEYMAVMDLPAEFYLQTIKTVFQEFALPRGTFRHRGTTVDPSKIKKTALMTVEGERDDICGVGQTSAAHGLCRGIAKSKKRKHVQSGVGHFGVFNGRRWRNEIQPEIAAFIADFRSE